MTALAWRLTRLGGRSALFSTGLTALAVAVATLLLQFAVAGNFAFAERADRTDWRNPVPAEDGSVIIATAVDYYGPNSITRIDLAQTASDGLAPPGLADFPEPGEVWVSPALADLLEDVPAEDFLDRYEGAVAGELGDDALAHADELVAVVGRDLGSAAMTGEREGADVVSPTAVAGFDSGTPDIAYGFYQILMVVATILMAVPVAIFGAAAARLTVARRDERLATLRLIGATPGQIVSLTLIETTLAAISGALVGTVAWMAVTPLISRIPIDGGPWFVADLWAGAPWMIAVALAVPILAAISALIGLRSVVISPLGVARKVKAKGLRAIRVVVFAVCVIAFLIGSQMVGGSEVLFATIMLGLLAACIAAMNLMGPWVVQMIGRIFARTARHPARMLAGRRLAEDPKAAWRAVAGVSLAGFIAGSIALVPMVQTDTTPKETETVAALVDAEDAEDLAALASAELDGLADVDLTDGVGDVAAGDGQQVLVATTPGEEVEHVRTILTTVLPGDPPVREIDATMLSNRLVGSIRVGVTVVLAVVFATAAVSAAISAIGSVLDRRQAYRLLHLAGTPQRVLDQARRQETLLPLAVLGGTATLTGLVMTAPIIGGMGFDASGVLILGATVAIGTAAVVAAGSLSRPLLASVMRDVSPQPD
ncbi:FtsX-like permease family protein [Glycomyces buryatensis]|uniref:ABC transporter permease n=1 Tax=Glycomyces buryatensis TaxID=2570927 RepID=A0A4S8Q9H7_9ACTN|nr:FtsX-like permease family protein [Glycomyces buryatensis]THV40101.1 ABC transporter permease [Glycomyces buryatensis]